MSFRRRVAALVAASVAIAFLVASLAMFASTRRALLRAVDAQLHEAVDGPIRGDRAGLDELRRFLAPRRPGGLPAVRGGNLRGPGGDALRGLGIVQLVTADGRVLLTIPADADELPVTDDARAAAADGGVGKIRTVRDDDASYRVIAAAIEPGVAVQIARPINDIETGLRGLLWRLAILSLVGVGLAFVAGGVVADRILRPVRRLTATAELIAETQELAHRAEVVGDDELARLAVAMNRMLTALDTSRQAQQQLVADASHELRTPLTSLRTNVEMLASSAQLTAADRSAMRADIVGQIEEMTLLVGNLVDLAREGSEVQQLDDVRLDELVAEVVERQQRLAPQVRIELTSAPSTIPGDQERLRRAVSNLVDNAVKYGGAHGPIEVAVVRATVVVRDHGPGVPDEHRSHVFDRFWRAPSARGEPGSGLGLAIVAQVAHAHGGSIEVTPTDGGGATFTLSLGSDAEQSRKL